MLIDEVISRVMKTYSGLEINKNWGEKGLFYNPGKKLKLGAICHVRMFCIILTILLIK